MDAIKIKVGQDWRALGSLTTTTSPGPPPVKGPLDITSCNLKMEVKTADGILVATCDTLLSNGSLTITDAVNGKFTIWIVNAVTASWPVGVLNWDLWLIDGSGFKIPITDGQFNVVTSWTTDLYA